MTKQDLLGAFACLIAGVLVWVAWYVSYKGPGRDFWAVVTITCGLAWAVLWVWSVVVDYKAKAQEDARIEAERETLGDGLPPGSWVTHDTGAWVVHLPLTKPEIERLKVWLGEGMN